MTLIMFFYYIMAALVSVVLIWNFFTAKDRQKQFLYILTLLPLLLRLFRLK
ncbi:MAG TPA: hypothetical protein P5560_09455 [Thermotogota bacterium]|nr:hypothetical protein [Thermotogota bacterium]HRW93159.1 hypothetical protein [Thermotogota bacterium]